VGGFCFFLNKIAAELGMSYERVRHLVNRAEKVYNVKVEDYATSLISAT